MPVPKLVSSVEMLAKRQVNAQTRNSPILPQNQPEAAGIDRRTFRGKELPNSDMSLGAPQSDHSPLLSTLTRKLASGPTTQADYEGAMDLDNAEGLLLRNQHAVNSYQASP